MYIVNCDGYIDFNPRSHEGSDSEDRINIYQVNISIHAPTRGATPVSTPIPGIHCIFQSTLPRGERLLMFCLIVPLLNFNPRSHEGSDILPVPPPAAVSISIHAPTRGATVIYSHKKESRRFQSTLPRGERRRSSHKCI